MDALISVISEIGKISNTVGHSLKLELPQIIVVGSQSCGKSSVLEGIVGWDFLPRGTGIVTRRPLVLNLVNVPDEDSQRQQNGGITGDWATFEHLPNRQFTNFEQVRQEIIDNTVLVVGNDKNISAVPINLTIYSSKVINLSLVDLPGIVRMPIGNQTDTIEEDIRGIVDQYIRSPRSLILAVTPANADIATSDALHVARLYDPTGERTICVLTKLDIMNPGTNAMNELMGQTIPVRLGIIGVINRSQEEIAQNIDIETCLTKEQTFFRENYPSIASRNGFQYLRQRLNQLLIQHIAQNLPSLRDGINNMVIEHEAILEDLGEPVEEDQSKLAIEVIRKFAKLFENLIDGWNELDTTQLAGGARIGREFRNFSSFNSIAADGGLTEMVVITAMRNAHGTRVGLLAPGNALEQLTKRQTSRLREPSIKFVDVIKAILLEIIDYCTIKIKEEERNRFPLLYSRMNKIACGIVNARFQPTKEFVEKIVDMQLNYNNFKHPTFNEELDDETKQNIANCIISAPQRTNPFSDDENENDEIASSGASEGYGTQRNSPLQQNSLQDKILIDEVRDSIKLRYYIKQYYNIVRISLQDLLPKAIMTELVNHVKESMQRLLEEKIFALEDVQKLTKESEAITNRREETKEKLEDLEHAKELLQGIVEQNI